MKLIIIELLYHHECLEYPYNYFKEKNHDVKLILGEYVNSKITNSFDKIDYVVAQPFRSKWLSKKGVYQVFYFFKEFFEIYDNILEIMQIIKNEKPDMIYLNTIDNPFLMPLWVYLRLNSNIKKYYVVHRVDMKYSENKSLINTFINKIFIYPLYKNSEALVFLAEYLDIPYIHYKKKLYFNNRLIEKNQEQKYSKITIVIPGVMNMSQRDYKLIFNSLRRLLDKRLVSKGEFKIKLLSKITGEVKELINLFELNDVVDTYDNFIPEEEYKKTMKKSHICIIPTYKHSNYGRYKISGAWGDAIAYGIKIMIPDWYAEKYDFGSTILRYNEYNIDEKLLEVLKSK